MRSIFKSKFRITQPFGPDHFLTIKEKQIKASDYYAKWGLRGHEGLDLVPGGNVWDVLCLEDGIVVRDIDDENIGKNYGKNVTVWHPAIGKATQYCHLNRNSVKVGERLTRGQVLGVMGDTGNTSGAHVHLNLFDVDANGIRKNRDNGYFGGIDPAPFLEEDAPQQETVSIQKELEQAVKDRNDHHNDRMALYEELGFEGDFNRIIAVERIRMLLEVEKKSGDKEKEIKNSIHDWMTSTGLLCREGLGKKGLRVS